jgi:hypothetical protein
VKFKQKYVKYKKSFTEPKLLGESGGSSYLCSQCVGDSGLEKDLKDGWIVKYCWEDSH